MADNARGAGARAGALLSVRRTSAGPWTGLLEASAQRRVRGRHRLVPGRLRPAHAERRRGAGRPCSWRRWTRTASSRSRRTRRSFTVARSYRAFMQRTLREHLTDFPDERPLHALRGLPRLDALPAAITRKLAAGDRRACSKAVRTPAGGVPDQSRHRTGRDERRAAGSARRLTAFVEQHAARYADMRNHPDHDAPAGCRPISTSGTSRRTRFSSRW